MSLSFVSTFLLFSLSFMANSVDAGAPLGIAVGKVIVQFGKGFSEGFGYELGRATAKKLLQYYPPPDSSEEKLYQFPKERFPEGKYLRYELVDYRDGSPVYRANIDEGGIAGGYIGIFMQELTRELAASFGLDDIRGVLIAKVGRNSPAERGELRAGDIIVWLNGRIVEGPVPFRERIVMSRPGTKVTLGIYRAGRYITRKVEVGRLKSEDALRVPPPELFDQFFREFFEGEPGHIVSHDVPPPIPPLTREFLISRYWQFRHGEGDVISPRVKLQPNGTIIGIDHPNESSWGLEDGILVFYHISGVPSTRFTSIRREHGKIILSGRLLLPGHRPVVIHVLEELYGLK